MQRKIDLIYCGIGNKKLDQFAVQVGLLYGARLPIRELPYPIYFVDQDWKNPNLEKYKADIVKKKPSVCTVVDWEREEQEEEVFQWLDELTPLVEKIIVIPKLLGIIENIPKVYGDTEIILGYSVPTLYGKTDVSIGEFANRKVHLLGGSPHKQLKTYDSFVRVRASVVSVDCNYISMKATRFCEFWTNKKGYSRYWVAMKDVVGARLNDSLYTAFMLSCVNYVEAWNIKVGGIYD